jgi:UDP-N-acetylglucosamine:LPS N-acetylglucosamine transferase
MLADRPRLLAMAEAARAKARPAASETVAEACLELCP